MASRQAELERRLLDEQLFAAAKQATHARNQVSRRPAVQTLRCSATVGRLSGRLGLKDRASLAECRPARDYPEAKMLLRESCACGRKRKTLLNQISVEIGKLEVQVQNAIGAIPCHGRLIGRGIDASWSQKIESKVESALLRRSRANLEALDLSNRQAAMDE